MTRFNTRVEDHGTYVTIHAPDRFSYEEALIYLNRSDNECLHRREGATVYKALRIETGIAVMEVSSLTPGRIEIRLLELVGCTATEALLAAAHYVWEWFDLDANLAPFYQLAMGDPVLTALGFTTRKAEYIVEIARWMRRGDLTKQGLLALPDQEAVVDALMEVRGIGKWTAHYVAMRCLRSRSAFPIDCRHTHSGGETARCKLFPAHRRHV